MQIDIDFQVFKALTSMRQSESDSYNDVLRRLLELEIAPSKDELVEALLARSMGKPTAQKSGLFGLGAGTRALTTAPKTGMLAQLLGGVWFNGVHLPDGTLLRANYKGQTFHAEIKDGRWVDSDGLVRSSPSEAASAISNTNVNGWRFWHAMMPGENTWKRLDELKP